MTDETTPITINIPSDKAERVARALEFAGCSEVVDCVVDEYRRRVRDAFIRHCPEKHYTGTALDLDTLFAYLEARIPRVDPEAMAVMRRASDEWFMAYGNPEGGANTRWHITRDHRAEDQLWDAMAKMPNFRDMAERILARREGLLEAGKGDSMSGSGGKRLRALLDAAAREAGEQGGKK